MDIRVVPTLAIVYEEQVYHYHQLQHDVATNNFKGRLEFK